MSGGSEDDELTYANWDEWWGNWLVWDWWNETEVDFKDRVMPVEGEMLHLRHASPNCTFWYTHDCTGVVFAGVCYRCWCHLWRLAVQSRQSMPYDVSMPRVAQKMSSLSSCLRFDCTLLLPQLQWAVHCAVSMKMFYWVCFIICNLYTSTTV